jgi:hypothetical protein
MTLLTEPTRIVLANGQPVPNDPNFAFNSLLLHGDGTNGSTVITDSSGSPKTVTAVGNAQISTTQSKFGGSSMLFDGTGDRLTTPSNNAFAFGTGDFTVEAWVYESIRPAFPTVIEIGAHLAVTGIIFLTNNAGNLAGIYSGSFFAMTATGSLTAWNHYAWVRSGNSIQTFVNGIGGTATSFTNNLSNTATITVGSQAGGGDNYDLNGYIDDLRITKGVARYTSNFTPPTAPFPDF